MPKKQVALLFRFLQLTGYCLHRHAKVSSKDVSNDEILAIDYVLSMQYFRVFRWDRNSGKGLLSIEKSKERLGPQQKWLDSFLTGLAKVLKPWPDRLCAAYAMLRRPLESAFQSQPDAVADTEHWLKTEYERLVTEYQLPAWPAPLKLKGDSPWTDSDKALLRVWLHVKMDAGMLLVITAVNRRGSSTRQTE